MGVMTNTQARSQGNATNGDNGGQNTAPAAIQAVPFVRASDEHVQPGGIDVSRALTASQQDLGVFDLPAYGYLAHVWLLVEATGGAAGLATVAASEDGPWNILQNILLTEPNGAFIDQFTDGFLLYCANKYGGYFQGITGDPKNSPIFSDIDTDGNFTFALRVPVQLNGRDALGALPNQDSAGQFKLRLSLGASTTVYDTAPDTLPTTVRVRAYIEAWDQPEPTSAGAANQTSPPAVGTTSFWSAQSGISVANGQNTIELKRKGNFLRQIIFVLRTSGSRNTAETDWPEELRFERDAFPARYYLDEYWRELMFKRTGYDAANEAASGLDDGVRFHDYMHEFTGLLGNENRDLWQPTRGSTRLEITGSFQAAATLDILTNDVAIAENVFL